MDYSQTITPKEWVTDIDEKSLSPAQAFYLKNREFFVNIHGGKTNGQTIGKSSSGAANYPACQMTFPAGENYSAKTYSSERTNEIYIFIYNTNLVHFIYRVNVKGCDIVYDGDCLPLSAEPEREITQFRCWLDVKYTCKNWGGKRLIWTNGFDKSKGGQEGGFIGCLDVEASIATNSFTTSFFQDCSPPQVLPATVTPNNVIIPNSILPPVGALVKIDLKLISTGSIFNAASYTVALGDTIQTVNNNLILDLQSCGCVFIPYVFNNIIYFLPNSPYEYYETTVTPVSAGTCCSDPCDFVKLCVPAPYGCLKGNYLPKKDAEKLLANKMVDIGFQFMFRWVYYDGRKSTWSDPSSYYFQSSKQCFESEDGFARCMKLRIPVGNAMVTHIELAFRNDNNTQWLLAERIEKYKQFNNTQQQWYDRHLSEIITSPDANYSSADCSFDYVFCNDKQCEAIDPAETNKIYNPFPRGAQCLIPFKESIAFLNYNKGNCPLPKEVIDRVKINYDCTSVAAAACKTEYATVTVRAIFHDFWHDRNQFIYVEGTNAETGTKWFGGLNKTFSGGFEMGWGQSFKGKTKNLIVYVEGAEEYFAEMKQWKHSSNGINTEVGTITDMGSKSTRNDIRAFRNGDGYYYQEAKIKVPKGTRGFLRIASHTATTPDDDTSTFVKGITNLISYSGRKNLGGVNSATVNQTHEIEFNTCGGDYNIWDRAFVVRDNAIDGGLAKKASAVSGYVKDSSGNPIEGLLVGTGILQNRLLYPVLTDHNGFYHILIMPGINTTKAISVFGEKDCTSLFNELKTNDVFFESGTMSTHDFVIDDPTYLNNNYNKAIVKVQSCDGVGIPGIRVAMSGSKSRVSNSAGEAIFKIRNYISRHRILLAIPMDKNGCFGVDCSGNCNQCMPSVGGVAPLCFVTNPQSITQNLGTIVLNINAVAKNQFHLKYGGRYGFGLIAKGSCGNLSFVNKGLYLDIPKKCDTTNNNCKLKYDFTGITFPAWVKSVSIVRTKNLNPFELQWVVDKAEYVNGKVKLTIQSLNDYNYNNFFKTNTVYQYLKGDRLEFISNEKNAYYCTSLNYRVLSPFHDVVLSGKKDAPADFFNQLLIEDDGRVGIILPGTVIELQRPKECSTDDIYYTICADLPVINGKIDNVTGEFTTFDTYTINRKIGDTPAQEFEHHSPSDFWGEKITDIGTAHIVNQFEDEKRYDRNITVSDADDFNSFGTLEKTIGDATLGGIVAASISDDKTILIIAENDNAVVQTADDLLRVGPGGIVQAVSGEQAISNPNPKLSGRYGCQYDHIGSIFFGDGYATWADVNKHAFIIHDYQTAKEASFGKIGTWTSKRFQEMQTWNNAQTDPLNKFRFSTGYNHHNEMVMLTLKKLRDSGIDNAWEPWISPNETICYRPQDDKFYGQPSFTPEAYGSLNLFNDKGAAFITVNHGEVWIHPIIPEKWGEFYGVPVDQVVGVCMNKFPEKQKKGLSIEIQSEMIWFAHKVTTDNKKFLSEIPPVRFKQIRNKSNAAFLCDINSQGGLYGNQKNFAGTGTFGYYISCIFVRDNTLLLQYNSIDNAKRVLYDELDAIFFKFLIKEQSGFTGNL